MGIKLDRGFFITFNNRENIQVNLLIIIDKEKEQWNLTKVKNIKDSLLIITEKVME